MWQIEFAELLKKHFQNEKKRRPRLSLRTFAKRLKISPGALSLILNNKGEWKLTKKRALDVLNCLPQEDFDLQRLKLKLGAEVSHRSTSIVNHQDTILNHWLYQALLAACELKSSERNYEALAKRFGISENEVKKYSLDLIEWGYISSNESGICPSTENFKSSDGPSQESIKRHHLDNLAEAKIAIDKYRPEARDFTSFTFAGDPDRIEHLRREIRTLLQKASLLMGTENNNTLYKLSVTFFPLVNTNEN